MIHTPAVDVELRPWAKRDALDLQHAAASSSDLAAQFGDADLSSLDAAEAFIEKHLAQNSPTQQNFAIVVDRNVVGNVGLTHIDRRHETAWVSYWLAESVRGNGIASHSVASVADWAFAELGLFRLELGHRVNNPASCVVAVRAGFAPEGVERQKLRYGTERFDVETHARLVADPYPDGARLPITNQVVFDNVGRE